MIPHQLSRSGADRWAICGGSYAGYLLALTDKKVDHRCFDREISLLGEVKPVGGVVAKAEAVRRAGAERVLIP